MRATLDPAAARAVIERACDRHGGLEAFARASRIALRVEALGGPILWIKGLRRKFRAPAAVDVWPHSRRVVFRDFPRDGQVGIYDAGRVAIALDPEVVPGGPSHRGTFTGIARWRTWWPEDLIYFLGYALAHYLSLPFSLRDREIVDARRTRHGVELWVRFPANAETHSVLEGFTFDESGLLLRHDYRAEIMGAPFNGAHLSEDYVALDGGLLLATRRTVFAKPWHYPVRARLPIRVLTARLRPATAPGTAASPSSVRS